MHFFVSKLRCCPAVNENIYPPNALSPDYSGVLGRFNTVLDSGTLNVADPNSNTAATTAPTTAPSNITTTMSGADRPHGKQHNNAISNVYGEIKIRCIN